MQRYVLLPPRPRNPLQRILAAVGAIAVITLFAFVGAVALVVLLGIAVVGLIWFRWQMYKARRQARKTGAPESSPFTRQSKNGPSGNVVDGEYTVVHPERDASDWS